MVLLTYLLIKTSPPKVIWEEPRRHPSRQKMDSPAAYASCAMPTADKFNHSAAGVTANYYPPVWSYSRGKNWLAQNYPRGINRLAKNYPAQPIITPSAVESYSLRWYPHLHSPDVTTNKKLQTSNLNN